MLDKTLNYNEDSYVEITKNFCYDNLALKNFPENVLD